MVHTRLFIDWLEVLQSKKFLGCCEGAISWESPELLRLPDIYNIEMFNIEISALTYKYFMVKYEKDNQEQIFTGELAEAMKLI